MKSTLTIIIICLQISLQAQTYFSKVFGRPFPYLSPISSAISIGDTSYMLASSPYDYTKDTSKLRFILIDTLGNAKWTKDYGASNGQYEISKAKYYGHDTIIVCGLAQFASDTIKGMIFYLNENGDSLDLQTYVIQQGSTLVTDFYIQNNGIVLCGFVDKTRRQLFARKQDLQGNIIWHLDFGLPNFDETAQSITPTSDGGYIIVGTRDFPYINDFRVEGLILKINKFGQQEWVRYTGEFEYNYAYTTINPSGDGHYYLCGGWANNAQAFPNTWFEGGSLLAKIDEQGNIIWQKRYWKEIAEATLNDMVVLTNGDFVTCGNDGLAYTWPEKEISSIAKFSPNGDIIWSRQYDYNPAHNERLYGMIQTADNGFLMVGDAHEIDTLGQGAASDGWVLKVDSVGCDVMKCVTSAIEPEIEMEVFSVFPNPVSNILNIQFEQSKTGLLKIINTNGQELYRLELRNSTEEQINMTTYPNGVYWVSIQMADRVQNQKIVKLESW